MTAQPLPTQPLQKLRIHHTATATTATPIPPSTLSKPPPASVDIAYRVVGTGPVNIVLVAGMCVSHTMWNNQIAYLSTNPDYTILLLDNRGTGDSTQPTTPFSPPSSSRVASTPTSPYSLHAMSRDVWAVIDHALGSHSNVHLVGHSMGSMLCQRAALTFPSRITSLTLLCGHDGGWYWSNTLSLPVLRSAVDLCLSSDNLPATADIYLRLHFTHRHLSSPAICDESGRKVTQRSVLHRRYVRGMRGGGGNGSTSTTIFWDHLAAVRSHHLTRGEVAAFRECTYPKLVIYGQEDAVVLPRASRQLAARIGAQAVRVAAAHFAQEEAAWEVNRLLVMQIEAGRAAAAAGGMLVENAVVKGMCRRLVQKGKMMEVVNKALGEAEGELEVEAGA